MGNGIKQTKDDEKVLVYFETHLIPILVDYNKGGADWDKWDSVELSTAIIKYDSYFMTNFYDSLILLLICV